MTILLLALVMSSQQLTWYELYERGEKSFQKSDYMQCIDDMQTALEKHPKPGKNQFTRAVQKIDYKPYYYLALSQYRQQNLPQAFQFAQKAFAGDVVRDSHLLQADLAPILEAYRKWVQDMHQRYTEEEALISKRSSLIASLSQGKTVEVTDFLNSLENEDMFKDIRMYLGLLETWRQGRDAVETDVVNQLEQWLQVGETEKARQLFNSLKGHLPQETVRVFDARLATIPEQDATPIDVGSDQKDLSENESGVQESDTNLLDPSIVDFYRDELAKVERQKQDLDRQVASINIQNRQLRGQLNEKETNNHLLYRNW